MCGFYEGSKWIISGGWFGGGVEYLVIRAETVAIGERVREMKIHKFEYSFTDALLGIVSMVWSPDDWMWARIAKPLRLGCSA